MVPGCHRRKGPQEPGLGHRTLTAGWFFKARVGPVCDPACAVQTEKGNGVTPDQVVAAPGLAAGAGHPRVAIDRPNRAHQPALFLCSKNVQSVMINEVPGRPMKCRSWQFPHELWIL